MHPDEMLCGPDGDPDTVVIDRGFGKTFDRLLEELDITRDTFSAEGIQHPSIVHIGYTFQEVYIGVLLRAPDGAVVGGYLDCDLSLDDAHQDLGLGAELVAWRLHLFGSLPVWHHGTPGFSPAGAGAHRAAARLMDRMPAV